MTTTQRGAGYETKFMVAGTRYVGTFKTREEGEAWELEGRAALKLGKPVPDPDEHGSRNAHKIQTIQDLVEHVNKVRWSGHKAGFSQKKNGDLFAAWVGPKLSPAEALTTTKIEEYMLFRQSEKANANGTINRHLSSLSVLAKSARALGLGVGTIAFPWQKEGRGRLRFYAPEEETQILGTLVQWGYTEWADLFMFLVDTGARLEEAEAFGRKGPNNKRPAKLQWGDIRGTAISFEDTKTGTPRTVYATPRVVEVLKRMKARPDTPHGPFEWVSRRRLRRVWEELRAHHKWMGPDTVVHTFRHTCASRLVQSGVDLYRVMRWMGHKDITTTMRYAKLRPIDMEQLTGVLANYTEKKEWHLTSSSPPSSDGSTTATPHTGRPNASPYGTASSEPQRYS